MGNAFPKEDIDSWEGKLKAELAALKKLPCNRKCFDCGSDDTTWASPKLGIFICVSCSDVHRATGAHITCVKNFSTYLWGPDEVQLMKAVGNQRGRDLYGNKMVSPATSKDAKVKVCTEKYGNFKVQELVQALQKSSTAQDPPSEGTAEPNQAALQSPAAKNLLDGDWFNDTWPAETSSRERKPSQTFEDLWAQDSSQQWNMKQLKTTQVATHSVCHTSTDTQKPVWPPAEQSLDDFISTCVSTTNNTATPTTGHKQEQLIWANFGDW